MLPYKMFYSERFKVDLCLDLCFYKAGPWQNPLNPKTQVNENQFRIHVKGAVDLHTSKKVLT